MPIPIGMQALATAQSGGHTEAAVLGVLLSAETVREGAIALLEAIAPTLDSNPAAIAVRDRDGITLHVLAESGALQGWPARLEPQFAVGAEPGVDPDSNVFVIPLRANGRTVGALLLGDAPRAVRSLREGELGSTLDAAAMVLHALVSRNDAELRRRALALRSIDAIIDGMAHQMANPLTGASAIAQLLIEDIQDEGQRAAVKQIRQELSRAFAVLHDILDFQRDTRAHDGLLDLTTIAERILRFRGYAIREQGISLQVDSLSGYFPVRADARGLEHALLIVLRFAELRSHGTVNRCIGVRVVEHGATEFAVEITDSGLGTIPSFTPGYFDLAFRVEHLVRSADKPDLSLADSILRGCGGRLEARGSKTDGTTLALILPRAQTSTLPTPHSRISA
jgi:signal transduction histidine kinase